MQLGIVFLAAKIAVKLIARSTIHGQDLDRTRGEGVRADLKTAEICVIRRMRVMKSKDNLGSYQLFRVIAREFNYTPVVFVVVEQVH